MSTSDLTLEDLGMAITGADEVLLNAAVSYKGHGKGLKQLEAEVVRELTQEDIDSVATAAVGITTVPLLAELKSRHHRIAQMIAEGKSQVEISRLTGMSPQRISNLTRDPSFAELVKQYERQVLQQFATTIDKLKNLTEDAVDLLSERLESDPDSFTNTQALEIIKTVGDRAGYAPVTKSISVSAPLSADKLRQIKEAAGMRQRGEVKTIVQESMDAEYEILEENPEFEIRAEATRTASQVSKEAEA